MGTPSSSLCISTYNRPAALELCLQSVLRQTVLPAEIIIGDDGSTQETKQLIDSFAATSTVPVVHVWQADEGYRLAAIRNKSFAKAKREYIIQIDGDLILHPRFIEDHLRLAKKNSFVSGVRSMLSPTKTTELTTQKKWQPLSAFSSSISKKHNALRLPLLTSLHYWFMAVKSNYKYVLGANMAFWREDILKVNGYNEAFTGWGKEDNDLALRLINAGITCRVLKFGGIVYHLHHKESPRGNLLKNEEMLLQTLHNNVTFAEKGLNAYL